MPGGFQGSVLTRAPAISLAYAGDQYSAPSCVFYTVYRETLYTRWHHPGNLIGPELADLHFCGHYGFSCYTSLWAIIILV